MANNRDIDIALVAGLDESYSETEILKVVKIIEKRIRANKDGRIKLIAEIDGTVIKDTVNKLQNILKGKDLQIDTKDSIQAITKEVNAMAGIVTVAKKASVEKLEFAKANKKVKDSADDTVDAVNRERSAMQSLNSVDDILNNINGSGRQGVSVFQRFGNSLRDAVSVYSTVNLLEKSLDKVGEAGREALEIIKQYDDINVDLQLATGEDKGYVKGLISDYAELGNELGALTQDVAKSSDTFLRQGRSIEDTNQLIEDSIVLSKIAKTSSEDSSEILTATINGFKMATNEGSKVNDVLSSIDLHSASDASGIGEALTKVASMANNAGVSLEKTAAIIATIKDVTQDADTTIGTSLKTVLSRMNSIRAGKFIDEETGEALNDVEKVLGAINVSMRDANGQFKEAEEILDEVGTKWKTLDSNTQKAVTTAMGGTYQANKLVALFDNYDKVIELTNVAENSTGQALEKFNNSYLPSLEAKTQALQNSLEQLATTTMDDSLYASILDVSKGIVDLTTETGILKGALIGIGAGGSLYAFSQLAGFLRETAQEFSNLNEAMNMTRSGNVAMSDMQRLIDLTSGLSQSQTRLLLSTQNLDDVQKIAILTQQNLAQGMNRDLAEATARATLNTWGLASAQQGMATATVTLTNVLRGMYHTLIANPFALVTIAVTAGATAFNKFKQAQEEVIQSAREASTVYKDNIKSVEDYAVRYEELRKALLEAKGNEEETYVIKQRLLELQTELNDKFADEYGAINLVTDAYKDQTEALKNYNKEVANSFLNEERKGIDKATKEMTKDKDYVLSMPDISLDSSEGKELKEIVDSYVKEGMYLIEGANGTVQVHIEADAQNAYDTIHSFENDVREKAKELGNENLFDSILDTSSISLNKAKETIDEYGDIFKQSLMAELVIDDSKATIYNEALSAVEEYNNAVLGSEDPYNDEKVANAKKNLDEVKAKISENTEEWGKYSSITEEVFAQADTRLLEFNNALEGNKNLLADIENLKEYDDVDLQSFNPGENNSFDRLKQSAEEYGLSVDELIGVLGRFGVAQNNIDGDVITDSTIPSLSISETVETLNTKLKPAIDSLSSAYQDIFTSDGFTRENIGLSMFDSIKSELDEMSEAGLEIDLSSFENLVTVLNDTESTSTQIKDAFDQMAYSIANAAVSGVEDFGVLKESLKQLGFVEYELAAIESLVQNTEALKEAGLDLASATEEQIAAFANEMVSAEDASQAINILTFAKELYNLQTMDTSGEVANLLTLAENAGYTGDVIKYLTELELIYQEVASGTLTHGALTGKLARAVQLKGLIETSAAKINFAPKEDAIDWKPLEKSASKAGKSTGEEYKEALEGELSDLGDVISYVNDIIGDQIDLYEDQKNAAVDALEAEKEAAEAALQAQIDLVEAQIDGIEDQIKAKEKEIKAIEDARKQRELEIAAQKAQYDLARMQSQKTSLIYKTGNDGVPGQMEYQHDIQGIRDAKENYDKTQEDLEINRIEKEIDILEDEISGLEDVIDNLNSQIEATNDHYDDLIKQTESYYDNLIKGLEEYQSRWNELANIEKEAKMKVILQELNITTDDILNMSGEAFEAFKQQYLAILTEMYSGEEQMVQAINDVANGVDTTALTEGLNKTKENIDNLSTADYNSVSTGLNNVSSGMDNVGTSAGTASTNTSAVSEDLQEINTNTEGLDSKLNNISSALTNMPDGSKFDGLADSFTNLGSAIEGVASALGIAEDGTVSGLVSALNDISSFSLEGGEEGNGIIAQFQNLKSAVDEVTSAINGGVSGSGEGDASNSSSPSMSAGNSGSGQNGLTGAIKEIGTTTDTTLGTGGGEGENSGKEGSDGGEGVIGKFSAFKTAVDEVTKAIGTGEEEEGSGEEGASSLIGALQLHYEKAEETLPEVKSMFDELLESILACVSALGEMAGAMSSLGGNSTHFANGTVGQAFVEGTVGKAFAKGTGRFKGLPHAEKNALRSEYGQPELTVYPDGTTELTTEPTMSDLPKDTVIFNEEQTKHIMNNEGTVIGNAYADGNVVLKKTPLPDYLRPLQEGDEGYELTKKFLAHRDLLIGQIMPPVNAIERNMEMLTRNISNVNTDNRTNSFNVGDITVHCKGITSQEVAKEVGTALKKELFGMHNYANQKMSITR